MATELACVNHPSRETRVRCSSCDSPICTDCMRQSPVGMKCPSCAQLRFKARSETNPNQLGKAAFAGFSTATLLGAGATLLQRAGIFFGGLDGFFIPAIIGLLVGEVTVRASLFLSRKATGLTAAATTLAGLVLGAGLAGRPVVSLLFGPTLIGVGIAVFFAWLRGGR